MINLTTYSTKDLEMLREDISFEITRRKNRDKAEIELRLYEKIVREFDKARENGDVLTLTDVYNYRIGVLEKLEKVTVHLDTDYGDHPCIFSHNEPICGGPEIEEVHKVIFTDMVICDKCLPDNVTSEILWIPIEEICQDIACGKYDNL